MGTTPRWKFWDLALRIFALQPPTGRTGIMGHDKPYLADSRVILQFRQSGFLSGLHKHAPDAPDALSRPF